jgi:hypothetical protein
VARAYQQLSPLCESAYRELGVPGTFREALERAFGRPLSTPDAPDNAPLLWNYATARKDERIEVTVGRAEAAAHGPAQRHDREGQAAGTRDRDAAHAETPTVGTNTEQHGTTQST